VAYPEPHHPANEEEVELVRRTCEGDRAAAEELFRRFAPLIASISRRGCHDLLDELFLSLHHDNWRKLRTWSAAGLLKSWISIVARRLCGKMLKDSGRWTPLESQGELRVTEDDNALRQMIRSERVVEVLNAIERLEQPRDRLAIRMHYLEEMSAEEVAAQLDCTAKQFHLIRFRAIERLRNLLKGAMADVGASRR
jgi:RNA polymerase sigma factor (sigma-70 family)